MKKLRNVSHQNIKENDFESFYKIGEENKMFASVFMTSDDLVISFQS